ncbi:MAG TPA: AAA family ATPase [Candidatus Babeliales bacterium]|nr:AAA family ATPase [Candidatus Babeliales bacterium]
MNNFKTGSLLLIGLALLTPLISYAQGEPEKSTLCINYRDAFDQTKLHEQYKDLMVMLNCQDNVCIDGQTKTDSLPKLDTEQVKKLQKEYTKACTDKLKKAHKWVIMEPARESLTLMALIATATTAVIKATSKDSMGGSFSIFNAFTHAAFLSLGVIRSGFHLAFPPTHPLNPLENLFAKNQCFIPKALWPIIIEKFTIARQNQFEQRDAMNFLEFALGLTTYQPSAPMTMDANKINGVINELHKRIDSFFAHYNDASDGECCRALKINIAKFVLALAGDTNICPRYIYLHGPGGIGKTHFVRTLAQWFQELLPDTTRFNDLIITSADELEGNQRQPGSMLRVLRNQLMGKKRGSIVFMDEATWLNKDDMISPAKRVFNGNQSKLSTSYFGSGMDGTGINLKLPPMLIFVASNEEIKDTALASRFDTIQYPTPTPTLLIAHALHVIKNSKVLPIKRNGIAQEKVEEWITQNKINNFRVIESKIEQFMMAKGE